VLDVKVNNEADARGPIPQASQWLAQFRPRATNVGTRASTDAASRAGADGGHYRKKFGRRGDPKERAALRPGEWELKLLNPF
jgi:hypothetical protein